MIHHASTVQELVTKVAALNDVCILTDSLRGGMFVLNAGSETGDGGTTAPSTSEGLFWKRIFQGDIMISWYGAKPDANLTGTTVSGSDSAMAINLATKAIKPYPVNDFFNNLKCKIKINNGDYRIDNPIYVRKGQHLAGEGLGATILLGGGFTSSVEKNHILLGMKMEGSNSTGAIDDESNGLPPEISSFTFWGAASDRAVVFTNVQGASVHDVWFLNAWQGILCGTVSGDLFINSCVWDQPSREAIIAAGFNILISNCTFYRIIYGIYIKGGYTDGYIGTNDVQIIHCKFEFNRQTGTYPGFEDRYAVRIGPGDRISNIAISNCIFTYYDSNPKQHSVIRIDGHHIAGLKISNCMFNNWSGWVIADNNPNADLAEDFFRTTSNGIFIENCNFNGNPSSGQYKKAVDASNNNISKGILLKAGVYYIHNCTFRSIAGQSIVLSGDKKITLHVSSNLLSQIDNKNTNSGTQIIPS